jgi:nicotinamidase-related amidase
MSTAGGAGLRTLAIGLVVGLVLGGVGGYVALGPGSATTITSTQTSTNTTTFTVTQSTSTAAQTSSSSAPTLPSPASVSVDPRTSAVLVLDYVFCYRMTGCNATLPAIQALLVNARSAGAPVIYTRVPIPKEIANASSDTVITNDIGPDKYLNTSLASLLQSKGIKTVVIVGIASNGALLYTAQESCVRHFTVVLPADTLTGSAYVQAYVPYQLLNGPGCGNANNTPLSPNHATLSTTSGITFKAGP